MGHEKFLEIALSRIPAILSLQDRNQFSPSYGSFDREHWQYKKTDTPYASVQCASFSLTLLYKNKLPNNPYFQNKKILEWITAGLRFLGKIQKSDGSFDEYYPNERSYIGTALTLYPCAEAFALIKDEIDEKSKSEIAGVLMKSAEFLSRNSEPKVLNQETMAMLAVYVTGKSLDTKKFDAVVRKKRDFILSAQSSEGWFPEYGGCDVGYLSYTIDFLSTYYKKSSDEKVLEAIDKAIEFISYFVHPNGTAGGEYTARNTEYLVPHGFMVMSERNALANSILHFIEESLTRKRDFTTIDRLDNRYLPLYTHQYIQTYLDFKYDYKKEELPFQRQNFTKHFRDAGIMVKKQGHYYIIIGIKKGGVIRIYDTKTEDIYFADCGYVAKSSSSVSASSYLDEKGNGNTAVANDDEIVLERKFYEIAWLTPSVVKHIVLRIILFNSFISKIVREQIKKRLITRMKLNDIKTSRVIQFKSDKVIISDEVMSNEEIELYNVDKFSFRYIPSSAFFQEQEIRMNGIKFKGKQKYFKLQTEIQLK